MTGRTDILLKEVKEVLEWDILKFWPGMQDPRGGFYGKIAEGLAADKDADREEQLNARIIWAFSNAYRLFRKKEYLMPAMNGKDYFIQHFIDHKYGGAFVYVDSWGEKKDTDAILSSMGPRKTMSLSSRPSISTRLSRRSSTTSPLEVTRRLSPGIST